jgi:RHS repeat-associated protein
MQQTGTAGSYDLSSDYRYGYNGKEKDDEIKGEANSLDYGARIYDPRVGRWMSTDPLESKYPSMSAYNYVANTPIMAIDPDGREVELFFNNQEHVNQMLSIINTGIGINVASVNNNRRLVVSILSDEQLSNLTDKQRAAYMVFKAAATDPRGVIGIDVFAGTPLVTIGSCLFMAIDVQDIQAFDKFQTKGTNSLAVLAHEFKEQQEYQLDDKHPNDAHDAGIDVEDKISGYKRNRNKGKEVNNLYPVSITHPQTGNPVNVNSGTIIHEYSNEKSTINQKLTVDKGNITNISEDITPKEKKK